MSVYKGTGRIQCFDPGLILCLYARQETFMSNYELFRVLEPSESFNSGFGDCDQKDQLLIHCVSPIRNN